MREESQNRAEVALSAARTRLAPPLFGLLAGVAAGAAMPRTTEGTGYFGVVVQVLPVLLLALAIEARAFSSRARVDADEGTEGPRFDAGTMEMARQVLLNPRPSSCSSPPRLKGSCGSAATTAEPTRSGFRTQPLSGASPQSPRWP